MNPDFYRDQPFTHTRTLPKSCVCDVAISQDVAISWYLILGMPKSKIDLYRIDIKEEHGNWTSSYKILKIIKLKEYIIHQCPLHIANRNFHNQFGSLLL